MNDSHTQNIEAPDRPATEIEGDVQACGEKFKASRKDAAYCSAACRQRAHRQRSAEALTAFDAPRHRADFATCAAQAGFGRAYSRPELDGFRDRHPASSPSFARSVGTER